MNDEDLARYLSGERLYGDDFGPQEIRRWYEQKAEGYADLGAADRSAYSYGYHALNQRHGFSRLPPGRLDHVLGVGSAWGDELLPVADRADRITILESSERARTDRIGDVPVEHRAPQQSGDIDLPDASVDVIVCFGVLHHIPNVSHVLREFQRVLRVGGHLFLREPIVSMGDWTKPRPGLTGNEREIPLHNLEASVRRAGLALARMRLVEFPPWVRLSAKLTGGSLFNSRFMTIVDDHLCALTRWNCRYHARRTAEKFRPTLAFEVAAKRPGS